MIPRGSDQARIVDSLLSEQVEVDLLQRLRLTLDGQEASAPLHEPAHEIRVVRFVVSDRYEELVSFGARAIDERKALSALDQVGRQLGEFDSGDLPVELPAQALRSIHAD